VIFGNSYGRGLISPEAVGNSYGNVTTIGSGRNGWRGYGLDSRYCFMKSNSAADWGVHDNSHSWLIYGTGTSARDVKIGGGVSQFSRNHDRWLCFANGDNINNGYAYYNQNNGLGTISDRRIKEKFQVITPHQSIAFIKALEPTSFCLKPSEQKKVRLADGTEVEEWCLFLPSRWVDRSERVRGLFCVRSG